MESRIFKTELGGRELSVETGQYAMQADGSCIIRCGDTALLVCATVSKTKREGIDFFPLSVEYEEKLYSVGKIPGGFIKREGRPSDKAILTSRLIDRPIRPLFPKGFFYDVQVIATVLSVDQEIPPEVYAMIGSSVALSISGIPFMGPTGSVVVGYVDGEYIINPNSDESNRSLMHLTVSGTKDAVMMVEAGAKEVTEDIMLDGILFAHEEIKKLVAFIEEIKNAVGKPVKEYELYSIPEEINQAVREYSVDKVIYSLDTTDRHEREARQEEINNDIQAYFSDRFPDSEVHISNVIYNITKEVLRDKIINKGIRPDGRTYTDIRPIWCDCGMFARTHGSAVFTRGLTQVMTMVTLGSIRESQSIDGLGAEEYKRYMHYYNMPPYSTGEARPIRSASRREIGHGALAERAIEPVLPSEEEFPYSIRAVSEVISSNGSTSQASICASSMSLMNAGVPLKAPVAGAAMGLIKDEVTGKIIVLTDIQGIEDFMGDMDFKVAGTKKGITAIQMDIKIKGIDKPILERALAQAHDARFRILDKMSETIAEPNAELSKFAPKIMQFMIDPDKIREVIGSGGKTINKIIADTGVKIDLEDDGKVFILTSDLEAANKARSIIEGIVKEIEVGEVYLGKVTRIMPIGAFVELLPGKEGMCRIQNLDHTYVSKVEDVVNEGDEIMVKVIEIDKQGRINLSRKACLPPASHKKRKEQDN